MGEPGIGKTVMATFLVDTLGKSGKVLPFFCKNSVPEQRTAIGILRSVLLQLLQLDRALFDRIHEHNSLLAFDQFDDLWQALTTALTACSESLLIILIDGLDECEPSSREELILELASLLPQLDPAVRFVVTCRDKHEASVLLLNVLQPQPLTVTMDSEAISGDLHKFVDGILSKASIRWNRSLRDAVREKLGDKRRIGGTFLWISLVLQVLMKMRADQILKELDRMPTKLADMYARILHEISPVDETQTRHALHLVMSAEHPWTVDELATAIFFSGDSATRLPDDQSISDLGDAIRTGYILLRVIPFVADSPDSMVSEAEFVTIIHQSVKDYIMSRNIPDQLSHYHLHAEQLGKLLREACASYMQIQEIRTVYKAALSFAELSVHQGSNRQNLASALRDLQFTGSIISEGRHLAFLPIANYLNITQSRGPENDSEIPLPRLRRWRSWLTNSFLDINSNAAELPIHSNAYDQGLTLALSLAIMRIGRGGQRLEDFDYDPFKEHRHELFPILPALLEAAFSMSSPPMVDAIMSKLDLWREKSRGVRFGGFESSLCYRTCQDVVSWTQQTRPSPALTACLRSFVRSDLPILHAYIQQGMATAVKECINEGVNIFARDLGNLEATIRGTTLHYAAYCYGQYRTVGHDKILRLLIEADASGYMLRARDGYGNTVLHTAADTQFGRQEADILDGPVAVLLQAVRSHHGDEFLESLLTMRGRQGRVPLHYAVSSDAGLPSLDVVGLLLDADHEKGSLCVQDSSGSTPLHLALHEKDVECARALLRGGFSEDLPELSDHDGLTSLHHAVGLGAHDLVSVLLQGAKPSALQSVCLEGLTPLHYATSSDWRWLRNKRHPLGNWQMVKILLAAENNSGGSALWSECLDGYSPWDMARHQWLRFEPPNSRICRTANGQELLTCLKYVIEHTPKEHAVSRECIDYAEMAYERVRDELDRCRTLRGWDKATDF